MVSRADDGVALSSLNRRQLENSPEHWQSLENLETGLIKSKRKILMSHIDGNGFLSPIKLSCLNKLTQFVQPPSRCLIVCETLFVLVNLPSP